MKGDYSSTQPDVPVEAIIGQEIDTLWKTLPEQYAFDQEELSLIENEILSTETKDLDKTEIAKLVTAEKAHSKVVGGSR